MGCWIGIILGLTIGLLIGLTIGLLIGNKRLRKYKNERDRLDIFTYTDID